ncbi:MAG: HlyD family type I secretion periplasmic adaptor subunit, partial [Gammaproteobacteria bacterium]
LEDVSHEPEAVPWPAGAATDMIAIYDKWIQGQLREYQARQAALDDDIQSREAELSATQAVINKLERVLPLITERVASLDKLAAKGMAARAAFLELEQRRIETEQDLATARERVQGIRAAIRERHQQRRAAAAEFKNTALRQTAEAGRRVRGLRQELVKAKRRSRLQILTAPVSGVVQQLAVHTLGGVVTPAQPLMIIVPQDHDIEVEAMIANKDIGFVHPGQDARVKVDAFPFTRYGIVDAKLRAVSLDAIANEKQGLVYSARVVLKENTIAVGDKRVDLAPGMTVTVEIRTGERRLIEYFLSPLMQYVDESLRER